jgi:hypothetical protein
VDFRYNTTMAEQRERSPLVTNKTEFRFSDDPEYIDQVVRDGVGKLRIYLLGLPTDERIQKLEDFYTQSFLRLTSLKDLVAATEINTVFLEDANDVLAMILGHESILTIADEFLQARTDTEFSQRGLYYRLDFSMWNILDKISIDNQDLRVLSPNLINPLTTWYVEKTFLQLPEVIASIKTYHSDVQKIYGTSIAALGYLYGKFSPDEPNAPYYKRLLSEFIDRNSPKILREHIPLPEDVERRTPRLQTLQGYWHQAFTASWMSAGRLEYDGIRMLSPQDRQQGAAELGPAEQMADTRKGAERQADHVWEKTDDLERAGAVLHDYEQAQHNLRQDEIGARVNLYRYTDNVLKAYRPDDHGLLDKQGKLLPHWLVLKQKSGHIFNTFIKHAKPLIKKDLPQSEIQSALRETSHALQSVLEQGIDRMRLSPQEFFADDFSNLAPIEQVSLIMFTTLTVAGRQGKPEQSVYLISNRLQELLSSHNDYVELAPKVVRDVGKFSLEEQTPATQKARQRLKDLKFPDGLVSIDDEVIQELTAERIETATEFVKIFDTYHDLLPDAFNAVALFTLVLMSLAMGLQGYAGLRNGELNPIVATPVLVAFTLSSLSSLLYAPDRQVMNSLYFKARGLKLLTDTLQKQIVILQEEGVAKRKKATKEIWGLMSIFMMVSFLAIFAVEVGGLAVDHVREHQKTTENTDENNSSSDDNIYNPEDAVGRADVPGSNNPEGLEQTPNRLEATIWHLPMNFSGAEGESIAYFPMAMVTIKDEVYFDKTPTMFPDVTTYNVGDTITYAAQPKELVYELKRFSPIIYPPDGFEIKKVLQVGGNLPKTGALGELYFGDKLPSRLILVTERRPDSKIYQGNNHIYQFEGVKGPEYAPWTQWGEKKKAALALNRKLSGDPKLQQLHRDMIDAADDLVQEYIAGNLTLEEMHVAYSDLAMRFIADFREYDFVDYLDNERMYSLFPQLNTSASGLTATIEQVSANPGVGYYCEVGQQVFQQFMSSIDIHVLGKPGVTVDNYGGSLYSRIAHINSLVLLPDGRVLYADMTPTRPTPGEDFSSMRQIPPDKSAPSAADLLRQRAQAVQNVGKALVGGSSLALAGLGVYEGQKRARRRLRKPTFEEKVDRDLPMDDGVTLQAINQLFPMLFSTATDAEWENFSKGTNSENIDREEFYRQVTSDMIVNILSGKVSEYYEDESLSEDFIDQLRKEDKRKLPNQKEIVLKKRNEQLIVDIQELEDEITPLTNIPFVLRTQWNDANREYRNVRNELIHLPEVRKQKRERVRDALIIIRRHLVVEKQKRTDQLQAEYLRLSGKLDEMEQEMSSAGKNIPLAMKSDWQSTHQEFFEVRRRQGRLQNIDNASLILRRILEETR